jgi:hypothetical protein
MSYEDACNALESRFKNQWAEATPIGYENDGQAPPSSGNWVTIAFEGGRYSKQASMGAATNRYRYINFINITVYASRSSGPHTLRALSDNVIDIFRGYSTTNVICRTPQLAGPQEAYKDWMTQLIIVPFVYDEIA